MPTRCSQADSQIDSSDEILRNSQRRTLILDNTNMEVVFIPSPISSQEKISHRKKMPGRISFSAFLLFLFKSFIHFVNDNPVQFSVNIITFHWSVVLSIKPRPRIYLTSVFLWGSKFFFSPLRDLFFLSSFFSSHCTQRFWSLVLFA